MSGRRRVVAAAGGALAAGLALYLLLWPLPVEPVAWSPPSGPPPSGRELPHRGLERLPVAGGRGPEDVARGPDGWLYTGVRDGRILRFREGDSARRVVDTGGRPMGLAFDEAGRLLVADRRRGLLRVAEGGRVRELGAGRPAGEGSFNDVAVAPGGRIYATVPSRLPARDRRLAVLAGRPDGRLLALDPGADSLWTALDSLHFPNGVAVGAGGAYLVLSETSRYRLLRLWLEGPRAGEVEVLARNLPGFPDGVSVRPDGSAWVALARPRSRLLDALAPRPAARAALMRAVRLWPFAADGSGRAVRVAPSGRLLASVRDREGGYGPVSSALEDGGVLYLGSFREAGLGRVRLGSSR